MNKSRKQLQQEKKLKEKHTQKQRMQKELSIGRGWPLKKMEMPPESAQQLFAALDFRNALSDRNYDQTAKTLLRGTRWLLGLFLEVKFI